MSAPAAAAKPAQNLELDYDTWLIEPIMRAFVTVLNDQFQVPAKRMLPVFREPQVSSEKGYDITISVSLATEQKIGSVLIGMQKDFYLRLMSKMLGENFTELTPDLRDGAREIANLVFNKAKQVLSGGKYIGVRSIPLITFGSGITSTYLARGKIFCVPFRTDIGSFWVEITTQSVTAMDQI